jgi:HNH endonuclease
VGLGRTSREPPAWMVRQVRYRDKECQFPGCGAIRFTQAHHIVFWRDGGRTALDNLLLMCSFHHKLVHEYGWSVSRDAEGSVRWRRPDGTRYRAGPRSRRGDPPPDQLHGLAS